jgi:hypothetical protein
MHGIPMGMWCSGNITAPEAEEAGSIPVISTIKIDHLWCPNLLTKRFKEIKNKIKKKN